MNPLKNQGCLSRAGTSKYFTTCSANQRIDFRIMLKFSPVPKVGSLFIRSLDFFCLILSVAEGFYQEKKENEV